MTTQPAIGAEAIAVMRSLQKCSQIGYDFGADLTDVEGNFIRALQPVKGSGSGLTSPQVTHDSTKDVPGTVSLQLDEDLVWGRDIIAPYMLARSREFNDNEQYRFPLGLYVATSPARKMKRGAVQDITGYDKNYLLQNDIGDTYTAAGSSTYTSNIAALLVGAGFPNADNGSGELNPDYVNFPTDLTAKTLDAAGKVYPCDDSNNFQWLEVINDLLAACGCRPLFPNMLGRFTIVYLPDPTTQPQLFVFSGTASEYDPDFALTGGATDPEDRTFHNDVWNVPNQWVFIQQGLTFEPIEGSGQYTVNNKIGEPHYQQPSDQDTIGRIIRVVIRLPASGQADLVKQGDAIVLDQLSQAATLELSTAPWPCAGHYDVFQYADSELPNTNVRKMQAREWQLPLNGGKMRWTASVVSGQ